MHGSFGTFGGVIILWGRAEALLQEVRECSARDMQEFAARLQAVVSKVGIARTGHSRKQKPNARDALWNRTEPRVKRNRADKQEAPKPTKPLLLLEKPPKRSQCDEGRQDGTAKKNQAVQGPHPYPMEANKVLEDRG